MRKFRKYKLVISVLFVVASVVVAGKYYSIWNANKVVSATQMEAYGKTYLLEYEYLVHKKVLPAYQKYFSFLKDKPFLIKATISNSHGAAIEFIPSKEQTFQCQTATTRIERAIFPDRYYNGNAAIVGILENARVCFSDCGFSSNHQRLVFRIPESSSVKTDDISVEDINYPNTIIVKGSNRRSDWSRKVAKEEALYYLNSDFRHVYFISEEFREFVATSEITQIANEIIAKQKSSRYTSQYGYLEMRDDLTKLDILADKHHIKHEFTKNILAFLKEQPSWRERHWLLCSIMVGFLMAFLIWCFKRIWQKVTRKQKEN